MPDNKEKAQIWIPYLLALCKQVYYVDVMKLICDIKCLWASWTQVLLLDMGYYYLSEPFVPDHFDMQTAGE